MEINIKYWTHCSLVKSIKRSKNNRLHGIQQSWYKNGNKELEYSEKDGFETGLVQWWYFNGVRENIKIRKNDLNHGLKVEFNY